VFNPDQNTINVTLSSTGLLAPIIAQHLHVGPAGTNGPVALDANGNVATNYTGTLDLTSEDPRADLVRHCQVARILILKNAGPNRLRIFILPEKLAVVGVVGHHAFIALYNSVARRG
jgi:hypothetical protein